MGLSWLHEASFALALIVHYLTVYLCSPFVNSEAIDQSGKPVGLPYHTRLAYLTYSNNTLHH